MTSSVHESPSGTFRHPTGLIPSTESASWLVEQAIEVGLSESKASSGGALGCDLATLQPTAKCGNADAKVVAGPGCVQPRFSRFGRWWCLLPVHFVSSGGSCARKNEYHAKVMCWFSQDVRVVWRKGPKVRARIPPCVHLERCGTRQVCRWGRPSVHLLGIRRPSNRVKDFFQESFALTFLAE